MQTSALKTTTFRLWRGPLWRRLTVTQLTVGRFIELVRLLAGKAAEVRAAAAGDITDDQLVAAFGEKEIVAFADLMCPQERPGFFSGWLGGRFSTRRNIQALLAASARVNDWRRLVGCLNLAPSAGKGHRRRAGSLMGDVQLVCRLFPSVDPMTVMNEWPMEGFLDFCDALNLAAEQRAEEDDPLVAEDLEPDPIREFVGLGSGRVVH